MTLNTDIYDLVTDDEDTSTSLDIDRDALKQVPRSFVLILVSNFLTKLGDAIASPKTTLAWVATAVGAPAFVLAFLVPIREAGSMIPQLYIGGYIRRLAIRKWIWVMGSVGQSLCVVGIGLTALYLEGAQAGWAMLLLIAVFALARSFSSIAAKDVLGKTIPKTKRGQLTGWSASAAGLLSVGVGVALMLPGVSGIDESLLGLLLVAAGLLWLVAAFTYSRIPELEGEVSDDSGSVAALDRAKILLTDKPFRRFVITRALLMCSALSAPFYVALAQNNYGSTAYLLGAFVAAAGIASLLSAPVWGRFADVSSKKVMIAAALVTSGIGIATFLVDRWMPNVSATGWFLPLAYFVLSIAHSGVRVGRKTYVVNLATGNQRTDYVAISNTVIGVLLLLVGSIGALAPIITNAGVIGLLSLMGLTGAFFGLSLPDVE